MDLSKCTSCGECTKVCPIAVKDEYNMELNDRKAIFKKYAQAIPGAYAITKKGTAPCKATCPAHVSIQGFIALINDGKEKEALALFKKEHPFPGSCGRVCHHPCEIECSRNDVDSPLAIQNLHRYLSDVDLAESDSYVPEITDEREEKIAVVGSGPAGLSTAYFLAIKGYKVTVFEKLPVAGGMMAVGIPEYRLPNSELDKEIEIICKLGVEIKTGVTFGEDITLSSLKEDGYKSLFIAAGLHGSRQLGIEGENLGNVLPGVSFLKDAALGKDINIGKKVVVIGGGNVAVDVALTARRLGSKDVTMVCLEARDEMPAWDYEVEDALEEKVAIENSFGPEEILGDGKLVNGIRFKKCSSVFDESGRFNPSFDDSEKKELKADTIIIAIGQSGEFDPLKSQDITIGARGGIEADPVTLQTGNSFVFAGGDAVYGPKSVVEAVASGKEAAESIHRYINGMDLAEGREQNWNFVKPDVAGETLLERIDLKKISVEDREGNFREVARGYASIDAATEADRCLKCGICSECYQCVDACIAGAINHEEKEEIFDLDIGALVLNPGCEVYDPSILNDTYHYLDSPNVMTSIEFERILSASGPTMGHLQRPSDGKEPKKIAWLQCVGSRDNNRCGNGYCSSVCCMYACKDAMIAKEHADYDLECTVFNMDIRTFGKDYEKYYKRAQDADVQFIKSRIHTVDILPDTGDLSMRYADDQGNICVEEFDIVVLSVGLTISDDVAETAQKLGVEVDENKFAITSPFNPLETTRPGVFASGAFNSPKDIPGSIIEASAAACSAGNIVYPARGTTIKTVEIPEEIDIATKDARVGVFVCDCGINIAGSVDVHDVVEYSKTLPNVVFTCENLFTCSQDAQDQMKEMIAEHDLNRVVVASCTPKTHEPIFMDTLESVGLNKYLFEMANIRNQNAWIHSENEDEATKKAKDLVRMAIARAVTLKSLHDKRIPVTRRALVIGGGIAGMNSALGIANQGYQVVLVEKEKELGGMSLNLSKTIEGADIKEYVGNLIEKVEAHEGIEILTQSLIVEHSGFKGNFTTDVIIGPKMFEKKIEHGVVILATGAKEYKPVEYLYGQNDSVLTQIELTDRLHETGADDLNQVVMIQCVGSRNDENPNCSRICCQNAVKNAISLKDQNPETDVYILYRDMRTYGLMEDYYTKARDLGVIFFRYSPDNPPVASEKDGNLCVTFRDHVLGRDLEANPDLLVLSSGVKAEDTEELASIMKVHRNEEGHFIEAHVKLRPVEMASEGIFVCGTAHSPQLITEAIAQSFASVSRATTFLSKDELTLSAVTAEVDPNKCASCLVCVRSCPFDVPRINEDGVSQIDEASCQGCGVCTSECPAKAIKLNWYEDKQLLSKVEALLEGVL